MHNEFESFGKRKSDFNELHCKTLSFRSYDYLEGLNSGQREAVLHREGPMLVTAGPGSGKTHVIVTRLMHMITRHHIPPEKILVITFTKEAARSMSSRFQTTFQKVLSETSLEGCQKTLSEASVNFGTFHSFYYQIIRSIPNYSRHRLIYEKEKKYILSQSLFSGKNMISMAELKNDDDREGFVETLTAAISFYKNTEDVSKAAAKAYVEPAVFLGILHFYDMEKERRRVLDFDDMLYLCLKLLREDGDLLKTWQERFEYYLVDEFQDCNPVQYRILQMLARSKKRQAGNVPDDVVSVGGISRSTGGNIFVVGDDDQAIYGFRGAESMILQRFLQDYPAAKQVKLGINYRCGEQIVKASAMVISENVMRIDKQLTANKPYTDAEKVTVRKWSARSEMNQYMRDFFRTLSKDALQNHAVLFRTNQETQMFAVELMKSNIPFRIKDNKLSIYEHFLVKDIIAFFHAAHGKCERKLFLRILNKPRTHIGREALEEELVDFQHLKDFYRNPFMYNPAALQDVERLEQHLRQLQKLPLSLGIRYIRRAMNYEKYLAKRADGNEQLLTSWQELLDWLQEDAAGYKSLQEWAEYQSEYGQKLQRRGRDIALNAKESQVSVIQDTSANVKGNVKNQGIHLMTMHASKGLEFDHCYILNVNEGMIPKYQKGQKLSQEQMEEERRIFYVGMTRAKKTLELHYLTGTKERPKFPSKFIHELIK